MKIYLSSPLLQPFIRHYMITEAKSDIVNRVLPNTSITMAFRFNGEVNELEDDVKNKMPLSLLSGLRKSKRLINYAKDAGNVIVHFKEGGAAAFIREPLYELAGQSLSLKELKGYTETKELEEQLNESLTDKQRISLVEHFLLKKLYNNKTDQLILHAVNIIQLQKGVIRIKELVDRLCISQDAFEKRFRRAIGSSPKQFAYLVRMKSIIEKGLTIHSLTDTALQAGYFDQSHFNKDFKLFTGLSPSDFIKSTTL